MRTLTFEQITDDRFDEDIKNLLSTRVDKITALLSAMEGVRVSHDVLRKMDWDLANGEGNTQYRCRFHVTKTGRKTTWDDIYRAVNSVKPVPYKFINA